MEITLANGVILKKIPSLPNNDYMAGEDGNIYSRTHFSGFGRKEYMEWYPLVQDESHKKGYKRISISHNNRKKTMLSHRLICEAFHGMPQEKLQVRHLDGNPKNNLPANLCWGTQQENWKDRKAHGNGTNGEKHPMSKLTDIQRAEIQQLSKSGKSQRDIAKIYKVSQYAIWNVLQKVHLM